MKTYFRHPLKRYLTTALWMIAAMSIFGFQTRSAGLLTPVTRSVCGDSAADQVRMKSHQVEVMINNGFVRTEVDQVFTNEGDTDIDAIYSFPVPKQASLSELSLWIDEREIPGEVLEKEKAREVFRDQQSKGNDTALAEKNDFKTFEIYVSPVRSHRDTRVRLVYYQPLDIDLNVGRYLYPLAEGNVDEERLAFWAVDDEVRESFRFHLILKSAFSVKDVRVPGFDAQATITQLDRIDAESGHGDVYEVTLESAAGARLDKDIIFYYRLDDSVPARLELIPTRTDPDEPGTFMLVITPAASLGRIAEGTDWTFVLDCSGSMADGKIAMLADGVSRTLGKMAPADRFSLILFNTQAMDLTRGFVQATPENVNRWIESVKQLKAGGSTAMFAGLKMAYDQLDSERTTAIILVSDGVCNTGPQDHATFVNLLKQHDIRLFTFIIGNSANQPLMEELAKESNGFAMNISTGDDIAGRLMQAKARMMYEAMHDVNVSFKGVKILDKTPAKIGSLYQGQQLVMFGRYQQAGDVRIDMTAKISGKEEEWRCTATLPEQEPDNPEIERLWALARIDEIMENIRLTGETDNLRKQIVDLGTEFSLVTDYTSMIVLKEAEFERLGIQRSNADRTANERQAQMARNQGSVTNYRADNQSGGGMFHGLTAPGPGSGPVGPMALMLLGLMRYLRRKFN